jgi:hypothetical protein
MPSSHTEICAYVNVGDLERVAATLTQMASCEGRRLLKEPTNQAIRYMLDSSDDWSFALLPGAPGWTVVHARPWNLLGNSSDAGTMRFLELCNALRVRGFLIDVVGEGEHGQMIVEADGCGRLRLSGWYFTHSGDDEYHGMRLEELQAPEFDICADLKCASQLGDDRPICDDICREIAHDVGGESGRLLWTTGEDFCGAWHEVQEAMEYGQPLPVPGSVILQFTT